LLCQDLAEKLPAGIQLDIVKGLYVQWGLQHRHSRVITGTASGSGSSSAGWKDTPYGGPMDSTWYSVIGSSTPLGATVSSWAI